MAIECVTLSTNHLFAGNPIAEQHRLRYRSIIERQAWNVPQIDDMEYDQYDNPATTYLIWRPQPGMAGGVSRLYPTDRPFMLRDHFTGMVTYQAMPQGAQTLEGSRFCVDKTLDSSQRKHVIEEIVLAYLEYGLDHNIRQIIGVMYPVYWHNIFAKNGWEPVWIGDPVVTPDGKKSRAAILELNEETLQRVRFHTGIPMPVLTYGHDDSLIPARHARAA